MREIKHFQSRMRGAREILLMLAHRTPKWNAIYVLFTLFFLPIGSFQNPNLAAARTPKSHSPRHENAEQQTAARGGRRGNNVG